MQLLEGLEIPFLQGSGERWEGWQGALLSPINGARDRPTCGRVSQIWLLCRCRIRRLGQVADRPAAALRLPEKALWCALSISRESGRPATQSKLPSNLLEERYKFWRPVG